MVLGSNDQAADMQKLVPNFSTHSFFLDDNEQVQVTMLENQISITRPIDDRKYSMMSFKPREENTHAVDITIEHKMYTHTKTPEVLDYKYFTSQDIREKYTFKARLLVGLVFALLLGMCILLLVTLLRDPSPGGSDTLDSRFTTNSTMGVLIDSSTVSVQHENSTAVFR